MQLSDLKTLVLVRTGSICERKAIMEELAIYLSPEDREKLERFRQAEDRDRLILGRAILGRCLEQLFGVTARKALELDYSPQGRPLLRTRPDLQFSVSHSGDIVILALALDTRVGVDVERIAAQLDHLALARRIMSPQDLVKFEAVPTADRIPAFFQAWTAKEAWLKARGLGIVEGMEKVSVPLAGSSSPTSLGPAEGWMLQQLTVPEGYCANLVWRDPFKKVDFSGMKF